MKLRELRTNRGLTAAELAAAIHVTEGSLLNWEKGKAQPRPRSVKALAEQLGVSVEDIRQALEGDPA